MDVAGIRNMRTELNGLNVSSFYHFSSRLEGGLEVNRFFNTTKYLKEEKTQLSAWDFDLNIHYRIPLDKKLQAYPLAGFSHTSEKEKVAGEEVLEKFWSVNAGAGLLYELGKWSPHLEYSFTWGKMNQQFLLAGISYEIEWGHTERK